jgi:hypothetical protein
MRGMECPRHYKVLTMVYMAHLVAFNLNVTTIFLLYLFGWGSA